MTEIVVDSQLTLRQLAAEHAVALFSLTDRNRLYLREWLPWLDAVRVVADSQAFIERMQRLQSEEHALTLGIWRDGELIGVAGHSRIEAANRIAHVGYWLSEHAQGQGVMTRCCRALLQHTFAAMQMNRVEICTAIGNHRSASIPLRLGFSHEGVRRHGEWLYDRFVDVDVFAMLSHVWRTRQAMRG